MCATSATGITTRAAGAWGFATAAACSSAPTDPTTSAAIGRSPPVVNRYHCPLPAEVELAGHHQDCIGKHEYDEDIRLAIGVCGSASPRGKNCILKSTSIITSLHMMHKSHYIRHEVTNRYACSGGQRSGCGIYSFPNGDRYEGECHGDVPHGHGVYRFAECGAVYEGGWAAGAKHGWCVLSVGTQQSYGEHPPSAWSGAQKLIACRLVCRETS